MSRSIWKRLGIAQTRDRAEIRRAYARLLKATHPEDDPDGFKTLREAYERALAYADSGHTYVHDLPFEFDEDEEAEDIEAHETVEAVPETEAAPRKPRPDRAPAKQMDEYDFALRTLYELVEHHAPKDEVANAVAALLVTPQIGEVDVHNATEQRLAELVSGSAPYADGVLEPAAAYFRWRERSRAFNLDYRIRAALDREDDLRFLGRARQAGGWDHTAWRTLGRKPGGWRTTLSIVFTRAGTDVRKMLNLIDQERYSLQADFDEQTLDWWRQRLERPLFPGFIWPWAMAATFVGALVGVTFSDGALLATAGTALAAFLVLFIPALIKAYWIDRPQFDPMRRMYDRPWWVLTGWAPAGVILLMAVSLLPPSPLLATTAALAGVGLILWAWMMGGGRLQNASYAGSWMILIWQQAAVVVFAAIQYEKLAEARYWQIVPLVMLLVIAFARGADLLYEIWTERPPPLARPAVLAGLAVASTLGIGLASYGAETASLYPLIIASTTSISLLGLLATPYLPPALAAIRHYVMWFTAIGLFAGNNLEEGWSTLAFGSYVLLGAAGIPALIGTAHELSSLRRRVNA